MPPPGPAAHHTHSYGSSPPWGSPRRLPGTPLPLALPAAPMAEVPCPPRSAGACPGRVLLQAPRAGCRAHAPPDGLSQRLGAAHPQRGSC